MKKIKVKSYFGTITIGQQLGYSNKMYNKQTLIEAVQKYQKEKMKTDNVFLSAAISECLIVLNNQVEPHFKLDFINYPKFKLKYKKFKAEIILLAEYLLNKLEQNRIVVTFQDETVMLEIDKDKIDPRI